MATYIPAFSDLIRDSFRLLGKHLRPIAVASLVYLLLELLGTYVINRVNGGPPLRMPQGIGPVGAARFSGGSVQWLVAANFTVSAVFTWLGLVYTLLLINIFRSEKQAALSHTLWKAVRQSLPLLLTVALVVFVTLGTVPVLIIPSVIVHVWYTFVPQVLVYEGRWGLGAMARSRMAIRGMWGNVFAYTLLFLLIVCMEVFAIMVLEWWKPLRPYRQVLAATLVPAVSVLLTAFLTAFRTALFVALRKINPPKRGSATPEVLALIGAVVGFGLVIMAVRWMASAIDRGNAYRLRRMQEFTNATASAQPSAGAPTRRPIGRIAGSAPSAAVSSDADTAKDFYSVGTQLGIYYFDKKVFPERLSDLGHSYFPGDVPINRETGKPFYYVRILDAYGQPNGYRLCPAEQSPENACYRQNVYY